MNIQEFQIMGRSDYYISSLSIAFGFKKKVSIFEESRKPSFR